MGEQFVETFFFHRIRHYLKDGEWTWDKGIEVKDSQGGENYAAALQAYHAYLGAYAYGHSAGTDYVACYITNLSGARLMFEIWDRIPRPEPEQEPQQNAQ